MNRSDLDALQSVQSYPALSILVPTHRPGTDTRQDQIRIKKLVGQVTESLLDQCPRPQASPALGMLEKLIADVDHRKTLNGLALFASREVGRSLDLPFTVKERFVIDDKFAVRDLVFALNHSPRYWVLTVDQHIARLFEGWGETLVQATDGGFPLAHEAPLRRLPAGYGDDKSKHRDERERQFLRRVDAAFTPLAARDKLPLILVGTKRSLSLFKQVSAHAATVTATLEGNHARTGPGALGELVWPLAQEYLRQEEQRALKELEAAVGEWRFASGINQVYDKSREIFGAKLLVEEGFSFPAQIDHNRTHLLTAADTGLPTKAEDAVDELIENVLTHKGQTVFVQDGALKAHQRVAMILPY